MIEIETIRRVNRPVPRLTVEAIWARVAAANGRAMQFQTKTIEGANELEDELLYRGARVARDGRVVTAWIEPDAAPQEPDAWLETIQTWLQAPERVTRAISTQEIAIRALKMPTHSHSDRIRIAKILRGMGYVNMHVGRTKLSQWSPPPPIKA